MNGDLLLLLRIHDGDDRCGCLRLIIERLTSEDAAQEQDAVTTRLLACLEHHPSGSLYRSLHRTVD